MIVLMLIEKRAPERSQHNQTHYGQHDHGQHEEAELRLMCLEFEGLHCLVRMANTAISNLAVAWHTTVCRRSV